MIYCLFSTNAGQNFCNWIGCCGKKGQANSTANSGRNSRQKKAAFNGPRVNSRQDNLHRSAQNTKSTSLGFDSSATTTTSASGSSSGNGIIRSSTHSASVVRERGGNSASGEDEVLLTKGVSWSTKADIVPMPKSHQRF